MRSSAPIILGVTALAILVSCRKGERAIPAGAPADGSMTAVGPSISVTRDQFIHAGMQLGGLGDFVASEVVVSNGYVDVPAENRSRISPVMGGFVTLADLLPGDRVRKGQELARLENIEYLKLQQNFLETREKLVYLKSVYEAQSALSQENVSSRKNYLQAKAEYLAMQANYESLAKQLRMIQIDPEQITAGELVSSVSLQAPFDGYITRIHAVNGMFAEPADVIYELVNTDHLHLELKVFEKDVLKLRKGQAIEFRIPEASKDTLEGELIVIGKEIEGNERTITVHAHIRNERNVSLLPGMYVEARIRTSERQVRGLPAGALISGDGMSYVLVMNSDSADSIRFGKIMVDVGEKHDDWFEVMNPDLLEQAGRNILIKGGFNLE